MVKNSALKITIEDVMPLVFRFLVKCQFFKAAKYLQKAVDFDLAAKVN
jgi:hypothetical protein